MFVLLFTLKLRCLTGYYDNGEKTCPSCNQEKCVSCEVEPDNCIKCVRHNAIAPSCE